MPCARYAVNSNVALMVQANAVWKGQDKGANAEPEDSGQHALFVSPGLSWNVAKDIQAYAFVQVPVYEKVNETNLAPRYGLLLGVSKAF